MSRFTAAYRGDALDCAGVQMPVISASQLLTVRMDSAMEMLDTDEREANVVCNTGMGDCGGLAGSRLARKRFPET